MIRSLERSFVLLFTALVGSLLLLSPLTARATDHDFKVSTELYNQQPNSAKVVITDNYFEKFLENINPSYLNDPDRGRAAFERDYNRAVSSGTILLVQYSSAEPLYGYVQLYFNYSRDCNVVLSKQSNYYSLNVDQSKSDCLFRRALFDANPIANYYGNSSSNLSHRVLVSGTYASFYSYNGAYTVDSSADGVSLPVVEDVDSGDISGWNDDCGLDIGCHLGNIGSFVKALFTFSEDNFFVRLFRFLVFPDNAAELLDFSDLVTGFKSSLKIVFDAVDLLRSFFDALSAPVNYWSYSNYCSTSLVGDAGVQDSAGHRYIFKATFFGHEFNPDLCSFERAIGGYGAMATIRAFTSFALIVTSLFIWYFFLNRILGERL